MPSDPSPGTGFASRRAAFLGGIVEALRAPAWVLGASYIGFGSLIRESGLGLWFGVLSTVTIWALPGQLLLVELLGIGASLVVIALAVSLTGVRFLPMIVTLVPALRRPGVPAWRYYVTAHLVSITSWAVSIRRCPELPAEQRLGYVVGLGATLWAVTTLCTAIGFLLSVSMPDSVALGLVFLNPIYFILLFATDIGQRSRVLALAFGAALGPLLHLWSPDWGLLLTGAVGGSAGYAADRWLTWRARVRRGE